MDCELNRRKIKYEDGKLWVWRETKTKPSYWIELKGCVKKDGYKSVSINYKLYLYHRVVYFINNPDWDIHNSSTDNMIDHIDRDRLNNNINSLYSIDADGALIQTSNQNKFKKIITSINKY